MIKIILTIAISIIAYADNMPISIISIYNNQLAFRVDIDGLDIKLCLNNSKPIASKLDTVKWYINKQLKQNAIITTSFPKQINNCLYSDIYINGKNLSATLKQKKLIK